MMPFADRFMVIIPGLLHCKGFDDIHHYRAYRQLLRLSKLSVREILFD